MNPPTARQLPEVHTRLPYRGTGLYNVVQSQQDYISVYIISSSFPADLSFPALHALQPQCPLILLEVLGAFRHAVPVQSLIAHESSGTWDFPTVAS
jgi:hypothetical protein